MLIVVLYLVAHVNHDGFGRNHAVNQVQIVRRRRVKVNCLSNGLSNVHVLFNCIGLDTNNKIN